VQVEVEVEHMRLMVPLEELVVDLEVLLVVVEMEVLDPLLLVLALLTVAAAVAEEEVFPLEVFLEQVALVSSSLLIPLHKDTLKTLTLPSTRPCGRFYYA
jgi:hypothetical protein